MRAQRTFADVIQCEVLQYVGADLLQLARTVLCAAGARMVDEQTLND